MTIYGIITTMAAGFIFPFVLSFVWGKIGGQGGTIGVLVCGGFIVGLSWLASHGAGMIVQGVDAPWVDQAWAVGIGLLANGFYNKGKLSATLPTVIAVVLGGTFGGFILSCIGK